MHFLLVYDVVEDYAARRAVYRREHLALARAAARRGELVLAGAFADPVDGAALVFQGDDSAVAERFAKADPYVLNGLVTRWTVRAWTTVVGQEAAMRLDEDAPPPTGTTSRASLVGFLRGARHWVISSIASDGRAQSAVVGVAVSDRLEMVLDTLQSSRKAANVRRDGRVSLVMWRGAATAQIEGIAAEPSREDLDRLRDDYFETFPDGRARAASSDILYLRVAPTWIRTTDFASDPPVVNELDAAALARLS